MDIRRITKSGQFLRFVWEGHVANWMWRPREERRIVRESAFCRYHLSLLDKFLPFIRSLKAPAMPAYKKEDMADEPMWGLWFQDESCAPDIVRKCIASVRKFYPDRYILLNEKTLGRYIELPTFIVDRWKSGTMDAAHYADIVRVELLARYGGYWFDATDYLTGPVPRIISESDFFMFVTSPRLVPHMFVQNCFIRSRKAHPLLMMWREVIWEYWRREPAAIDYFIVQMLFRLLVTHNAEARELFREMPKLVMDPTHRLWHFIGNMPYSEELYREMADAAFFQKCTYKRHKTGLEKIEPGTMADYVINGKI